MQKDYIFTSESVTRGHPDKLCDQISDAIVDRYLLQDPFASVVAESAVSAGVLFLAAQIASDATVDLAETARRVIAECGYEEGEFNASDCTIMTSLIDRRDGQHRPIDFSTLDDRGIDAIPARNQANGFGFACDETAQLMPAPIMLAHALARRLDEVAASGALPYLLPDGKTQVGIRYRDHRPAGIHSVSMVACQRRAEEPTGEQLRQDLLERVINPVLADSGLDRPGAADIHVNPDGPFVGGGPATHSGLTGRKNAIDTYGEYSRHGGAALSGKGPVRIDRVGAYAARHAAKNVVAAGLASRCEVQLTYSIGQARPVSVQVDTFGTAPVDEEEIVRRLLDVFDFRLGAIIRDYGLQQAPAQADRNFYRALACYGQVGRDDLALPWESTALCDALK
jgi:S-adenosylmethionine synthetase